MDGDLQKLLAAWLTGDIDDNELSPILDRLKADAAFRNLFVDEIAMHGQLKAIQTSEPKWLQLEELIGTTPDSVAASVDLESRVMDQLCAAELQFAQDPLPPESQSAVPRNRRPWVIAVTTVAIIAIAAAFVWRNDGAELSNVTETSAAARDSNDVSDTADESVAVLSQSADAQWSGEQHPVTGDPLGIGDLRLTSGIVQIEFLSGVRLLIRGPADVELRGPNEVLLREGAASCFVTEMGRGFRIVTREMEVIDVGTAFSIDVQHGKQSEVHVLEGSVEIKSPERDMLELKQRHAIRMSASGPVNVVYSPDRFPDPAKLRARQNTRADRRYKLWHQHAATISNDPDVLLHYTFEEPDPNALELKNHCVDASTATDGVVIGCDWTQGRWPAKRALLYRNANDRVLFQVPGAFNAVTFLAWVRIDALTQLNTSLMMTESATRRQRFTPATGGEMRAAIARRESSTVETVRWELNQKLSNVLLSVGHATDRLGDWQYDKAAAVNKSAMPMQWGQWACLAVTCDVGRGEVVHYRNGEVIGTGKLNHNTALLLDFMELGNFGVSADELEQSGGLSQRRFYGAMDEVVVARRIFDPTEITAFWLNGKP